MDRYKVLDLIGEGSFGRVFRGVQRDTGANVALKLIPKVNQRGYLKSISLLHLAGGSQRTGAAVAEVGMQDPERARPPQHRQDDRCF